MKSRNLIFISCLQSKVITQRGSQSLSEMGSTVESHLTHANFQDIKRTSFITIRIIRNNVFLQFLCLLLSFSLFSYETLKHIDMESSMSIWNWNCEIKVVPSSSLIKCLSSRELSYRQIDCHARQWWWRRRRPVACVVSYVSGIRRKIFFMNYSCTPSSARPCSRSYSKSPCISGT